MWSGILEARKPKNSVALLDAVLRDDPEEVDNPEDDEDPEAVVTRAEARARDEQKRVGGKKSSRVIGSKRNYAEALHRQADLLHHRGDYETALILYHRAASAYPRESSHGVAARRTATAISSATNPSRALRKILPGAKNASQLGANFCPETAALRANKIVEESSDPVSSINQILKYFDSRKDFWRDPPSFKDRRRSTLVSRSKIMLRQFSGLASVTLENLQAAFASGDFNRSLKIGDELLVISEALPNRYHYQVAARHYLAMTQIALGRHDRAVDQVSRMVRLARESGDVALRSRSMMTLGRVHLSFRHLNAAALAWERLVVNVEEAVLKAWLLHEIGRCYFEMKRYAKALETAGRCIEYADEGNSRKWLLHGKLLSGQALVELGRFGEAVGALKVAASAARDEGDSETHEYVSNLIDRVTTALRIPVFSDKLLEWNGKPVQDRTWRAKSDDTLNFAKQTDWPSESNENKLLPLSESMEKSKIVVARGLTRKITSPQCGRTKNPRNKSQKGRRNMGKRGSCRLTISPPRTSGIFDLGMLEEDTPNERHHHEDDLSSRLHDEAGDDEVTSRTRVIRKETPEDRNLSREQLPFIDGSKILVYEETSSGPDDEQSNRTGKTYVLVESIKMAKYQSPATNRDTNLELHNENQSSNKTEIIYELDDSNNAEYLGEERFNDLANFPVRACLHDEGIDEREEDAENEEEKASSLNRQEVFSSCESKISAASTGKTYVVDEKITMTSYEIASCYVDYEETMRSQRRYNSPSAISPSQPHFQRHFDSKITGDTIETTGDSSMKTDLAKYSKFTRLANLLAKEASGENEEKFKSSSPKSFFAERCEMDSLEIAASLQHHLATGESISTPRSYNVVFSAGQHPLYRHSLPTSPRNELQPQFP